VRIDPTAIATAAVTARPIAPGSRRLLRARPGFTLLELVIVTVILSILALIVAGPVQRVRHRAMVTAARMDVRNAVGAAERHNIIEATLPATLAELAASGFHPSADIVFCRYEYVPGASPADAYLILEARHRGTSMGVTTHYPTWNGRIDQVDLGMCPAQ
jgi:prepilin-type N-terminal cleavage/methylation domain-containing protein